MKQLLLIFFFIKAILIFSFTVSDMKVNEKATYYEIKITYFKTLREKFLSKELKYIETSKGLQFLSKNTHIRLKNSTYFNVVEERDHTYLKPKFDYLFMTKEEQKENEIKLLFHKKKSKQSQHRNLTAFNSNSFQNEALHQNYNKEVIETLYPKQFFLNKIDEIEMKSIFTYFIPSEKRIKIDEDHHRIDLFIPKRMFSLADSLFNAYDNIADSLYVELSYLVLENEFYKKKHIQIIDNEIPKKAIEKRTPIYNEKIPENHFLPLHYKTQSIAHTKDQLGFLANIQTRRFRDNEIAIEMFVQWYGSINKKNITSTEKQKLYIDKDACVIVPWTILNSKEKAMFSDFLEGNFSYYSNKHTPYLMLKIKPVQ